MEGTESGVALRARRKRLRSVIVRRKGGMGSLRPGRRVGTFLRNQFWGVVFQLSQAKSGPRLARRAPERGQRPHKFSRVFGAGGVPQTRRCRSACFGEAERRFQEKMRGRYSTAACSPSGSGRTAVPASPAFSSSQLRAVSSASASSGSASFAGVPPLMRM